MTKKKSIIYIAAIIVLGLAALVFLNLPKPITTSDSSFNLAQISSGTYTGSYDNGFVKVCVEVIVENHTIVEVRLLEHDNGLGSAAEPITDMVVQRQSVEVDSISGATTSSKTILKAVENALSEGRETK
ncbi:FMN-binding domain protein [Caprobacter fermentans]|uniref:FMN-binding domain protein n=1 Tax=Caproicibacter fermentans TaxID=2576756 RepID=A0A6N8I515_9FIRM|nr:FMN-binding protein [Caproicibacter fermentans]MVB13055.1 FMN-binding domain protein [Caproicibacter fermentans]